MVMSCGHCETKTLIQAANEFSSQGAQCSDLQRSQNRIGGGGLSLHLLMWFSFIMIPLCVCSAERGHAHNIQYGGV